MVVALGPGKFYGSSLPRPHIYTDVKLSEERVDPPLPIMEPFLSWANDAHWSMGGLSFKRHRLQGRIEGSIKKLRAEQEKRIKKISNEKDAVSPHTRSANDQPPPSISHPLVATKRRRLALLLDDHDSDLEEEVHKDKDLAGPSGIGSRLRCKPARKLGDDFDRVASEGDAVQSRGSPLKKNKKTRVVAEIDESSTSLNNHMDTVASPTRCLRTEKKGTSDVLVKQAAKVKGSPLKNKKLQGRSKIKSSALNVSPKIRTSPRLSRLA